MDFIRSAMIIALDVENSHWRSTAFHGSYFWPEAAMADGDDLAFPSSTDPSCLVADQAAHLPVYPLENDSLVPRPLVRHWVQINRSHTKEDSSTSRSVVWNVARHQQNVMLRFLRRLFNWSRRPFITFIVNQHADDYSRLSDEWPVWSPGSDESTLRIDEQLSLSFMIRFRNGCISDERI